MKKISQYQFLLWIFLSVSLFVFILPIEANILTKIIAGYLFYLFIKEIINYRYFKQTENADYRIRALTDRIKHLPRKVSVYIHDRLGRRKNDNKDDEEEKDMSQFMWEGENLGGPNRTLSLQERYSFPIFSGEYIFKNMGETFLAPHGTIY